MGKFKNLLALILSISLFSLYGFNIYAADAPLQQEQNFLYDGYTEEGVYYVVYSITTFQSDTNQKARIVVSRTVETKIAYEGHITPPSTYYYSTFDTGYNIQMSGDRKSTRLNSSHL